jgi:hypothetical protein
VTFFETVIVDDGVTVPERQITHTRQRREAIRQRNRGCQLQAFAGVEPDPVPAADWRHRTRKSVAREKPTEQARPKDAPAVKDFGETDDNRHNALYSGDIDGRNGDIRVIIVDIDEPEI